MSQHPMMAVPGDPDLDIDIDGVKVLSFVCFDGDFIVALAGGSGRWAAEDGTMEEVDVVTQVELMFGWRGMADPSRVHILEKLRIAVERRLEEWSKAGTSLRLVAAPGRMTGLYQNREQFVGVPRSRISR